MPSSTELGGLGRRHSPTEERCLHDARAGQKRCYQATLLKANHCVDPLLHAKPQGESNSSKELSSQAFRESRPWAPPRGTVEEELPTDLVGEGGTQPDELKRNLRKRFAKLSPQRRLNLLLLLFNAVERKNSHAHLHRRLRGGSHLYEGGWSAAPERQLHRADAVTATQTVHLQTLCLIIVQVILQREVSKLPDRGGHRLSRSKRRARRHISKHRAASRNVLQPRTIALDLGHPPDMLLLSFCLVCRSNDIGMVSPAHRWDASQNASAATRDLQLCVELLRQHLPKRLRLRQQTAEVAKHVEAPAVTRCCLVHAASPTIFATVSDLLQLSFSAQRGELVDRVQPDMRSNKMLDQRDSFLRIVVHRKLGALAQVPGTRLQADCVLRAAMVLQPIRQAKEATQALHGSDRRKLCNRLHMLMRSLAPCAADHLSKQLNLRLQDLALRNSKAEPRNDRNVEESLCRHEVIQHLTASIRKLLLEMLAQKDVVLLGWQLHLEHPLQALVVDNHMRVRRRLVLRRLRLAPHRQH